MGKSRARALFLGWVAALFLLALLPAQQGEFLDLPLRYALLGLGFGVAFYLLNGRLAGSAHPLRCAHLLCGCILAGAGLLRVLLMLYCEGYANDMACFAGWSQMMVEDGPEPFYLSGVFADYPPGHIYLLWACGLLNRLLGLSSYTPAGQLVLGLPALLCDLGLAALGYVVACRRLGPRRALGIAALLAFSPVLWWDTAVWKQVDSVLALALALCFLLLARKRWVGAALLYALALLCKPQALLFGPVLAAAFLRPYVAAEDGVNLRPRVLGRIVGCAALSIGLLWLCALPFQGPQRSFWLMHLYVDAGMAYPYASINAFNLFALLGGNWVSQEEGWLLSFQQWGFVCLALLTLVLFFLVWRAPRRAPSLPLVAAFYGVGVFTLVHNMHERYSIPAFVLLAFGYILQPSRKLLFCLCTQGFLSFMNVSLVLQALRDSQIMQRGEYQSAAWLCSLGQVLTFALLGWICLEQAGVLGRLQAGCRRLWRGLAPKSVSAGPFNRLDFAAVALPILLCGVLSFSHLGSFNVPETAWEGQSAQISLAEEQTAATLWVYGGLGGGVLQLCDSSGQPLAQIPMEEGNLFAWKTYPLPAHGSSPFTLRASGPVTVYELAFTDAAGAPVAAQADAAGGALFDEPASRPPSPDAQHGMYFDEIYFGRAAYELLHGLTPYESTHPPLGKNLIALGVALFGMNPFGWRFMGALFGVLLIPLFYLFARQLTGSRFFALLGALLYLADFMRFTLSRIATVDVFLLFFVLAAYLALLCWLRLDWVRCPLHRQLWPLMFSGLAWGMACSVKWNGVYAGVGMAIVFFLALWRGAKAYPQQWRRKAVPLLLGCVGAFVLVPAAVYLCSYLPYFLRAQAPSTLSDWWEMQLQMLRYHSALTAEHPYASRWWSWPAILRPVWCYMGTDLPQGIVSSIAMLGTPLLWWAGAAAVLLLLWRQCQSIGDANRALLLCGFFSLWLPWAFIERPTFLYHYSASSGFALLALIYLLSRLPERAGRRAGYLLAGAAAVLFCLYYPALTGLPVGETYARWLQCFPGWNFYYL